MQRSVDVDLIDRLLKRDDAALRRVLDEHGRAVYGMAWRVLGDAALAEEVAQDTFLALWRRPGAFDPARGSLRAFLLGVARNKAIDRVRREQVARKSVDSVMEAVEPASEEPGGVEHMVEIEQRHRVRDALARLSSVQREALVLAYFGGRTYREVAEELAIPEGTAKTRLRDGLARLRQLMSAQGGS